MTRRPANTARDERDARAEAAARARWMERAARALLALTVLALLGGSAVWVAQRPMFDIHHITLRGEGGSALRHIDVNDLRAALSSSDEPLGNFFMLRLEDARRALESVPWVAHASVRRGWPDHLVVTLTEHRAIGVWSDGRLLSSTGRLFVANPGDLAVETDLASFEGPPRFAAEAAQRFHQLSARLAPLSLQLAALEVSERASWSLTTASHQRIELGRDEPVGRIEQRVAQLVTAYPLIAARLGTPPVRIDLRYANGLAAAPAAGSTGRAKKS
jgi:cell division protein FtsQ